MSFARDVSFQDVSLYQFRVETCVVVAAAATIRVSPTTVLIPAANDVYIVTEYGWKARLGLAKASGVRFKVERGAAIEFLFPVDNADVRSMAVAVIGKPLGNLIAE